MTVKERQRDFLIIALAFALITAGHIVHGYYRVEYRTLYRLLYFIPVIFAAFRFGLKGGIVAPLVASVLYLPDIALFVGRISADQIPDILDVLLFNVIGWITGVMVHLESRRNLSYRALVRELAFRAYEKRQLEEQIHRSERLASLGQLVAGMAHEIRNPLGIANTTVQVMKKEYRDDQNLQEYATVILDELDRMNRVLGQFLNFARPAAGESKPVKIPELIESVRSLTSRYLKEHAVTCFVDVPGGLPEITADAGALKQALVNLIFNSVDAMPSGGRLMLSAGLSQNHLKITVSDTGLGIRPEDRPKIFDPFFSTKETGFGLGLAVVHRIIDAHGGYIEVDSEPGSGASVSLNLPLKVGEEGGA